MLSRTERVYLSLGSNLGNRAENLRAAVERLRSGSGMKVERLSSIYETEPQDVTDQPWFLNQVAECETRWKPEVLLKWVQAVEQAGGRRREGAVIRGPRVVDVDILLFGDRVMNAPALQIPHPRMTARRFVLEPLLELAPELQEPGSGIPLRDYWERVGQQRVKRLP